MESSQSLWLCCRLDGKVKTRLWSRLEPHVGEGAVEHFHFFVKVAVGVFGYFAVEEDAFVFHDSGVVKSKVRLVKGFGSRRGWAHSC